MLGIGGRIIRVAILKVVADIISTTGIDRILTVDLHADQIQGFFTIPATMYMVLLADDIAQELFDADSRRSYVGVVRARAIAKQIGDLTWR